MKAMLVTRTSLCLACKACEIACAVEHSASKDLYTAIQESPAPCARVTVLQGEGFTVPLQCRQCENAPCMQVCPTQALSRLDQSSPVLLEENLCIGCTWCVQACPFGVIRLDAQSHAIIKCDQCFARVQSGELPACVVACPTHALEFKTQDEILAEKREATLAEIRGTLDEVTK
ncbi:MAG: Iron-sulfur protein [bacterium ADurb.Bin429]|nr:MAG: Iron-sulfur protein [bacterium ADurb.Bin429]